MLTLLTIFVKTESATLQQNSFDILLGENKEFASTHKSEIHKLSDGQSPPTMVLTCSDSRVSTDIITEASLGDLFVHRNIANLYNSEDDSIKSALFYSTNVLKVSRIVVIGHTECGGVKHALELNAGEHRDVPIMGPLNRYISGVEQLILDKNDHSVDELRVNDLSLRNVRSNVMRIRNCDMVPKGIKVEGYMYSINNGTLAKII
eukprot:NODE_201_length_15044_cov_0.334560.p8 type:complete len:205 gc:universal NODE_201_length_15044_cov_0.334560:9998-9384(-)